MKHPIKCRKNFSEKLSFLEKLIFLICKKDQRVETTAIEVAPASELSLLEENFKQFEKLISGKVVLDFGCGKGFQLPALHKAGASRVIGIEPFLDNYEEAMDNLSKASKSNRSAIELIQDKKFLQSKVDVVVSQNSFEHYEDPAEILKIFHEVLNPKGLVLATFGPLWNSPNGSHMNYFCPIPWVHKILSEKSLMKLRSFYRNDDAKKYSEIPGGLNTLSLGEYERIFRNSGFYIESFHYHTVKNLPFSKLPILRELFVNHLSIKLIKK